MNTQRITQDLARTIALAACLLGLLTGAAACGAKDGTTITPSGHPQPAAAHQAQGRDEFPFSLIEKAKAKAAEKSKGGQAAGGDRAHWNGNSYPFINGYPPAHHRGGLSHRLPSAW